MEQEEKSMTNEKNIDELTGLLMEIDQQQVCFARNLFPRPGWRMECRFSEDESQFLYLVFDCLHNIPELEKQLVQIKKDKSQKANEFLVNLVRNSLSELHGLITSTDKRREWGNQRHEQNPVLVSL